MRKYLKNLITMFVCVGLMLSLSACGDNSGNEGNQKEDKKTQDTFLTREEVIKNLKNYSFKYSYTFSEKGETDTITYSDKRTENAWIFSTEGEDAIIFLANKDTSSLYMLYPGDKIGTLIDLEDDFDSFSGWGTHLFSWYDHAKDFSKKGTATVAGRTCNIYEYAFGTLKYSYFIDKEYDLCLKFEITESKNSMKTTFAFTEFKMGGVTTEEIMAVLEGYEIDDYRVNPN
ncbi:hypothetical protein [Methanobrevibacter sp. UBA313]|jgi:negative regulator of sigma E activity|uniref:hypothetical protein n=1 Tax=Methanobrevibacter sp. UBA313 TaxID=1915477 RepID=UPI0039B8A02E